MPRFVILAHDHPFPHWDLMFECGDALRTWRLLEEPGPDRVVAAEPLADHRKHYLDYEGSVSGDRGVVKRVESGVFSGDPAAAAEQPLRLNGTAWMVEASLEIGPSGQRWRFQSIAG
ncbi:MAG: hypothetical protein DWQ34_19730 [Planctomycetota bacterium]|nr:MAG: hypothetical protein DWQ34_19730 [Planctomycetota bacterium]REJ92583.1 MAG: hypothetical protein DWQ29_04590 [Planctomycetota bacterium]REK28946.1 MAG: hypothetical protein DWQ41_05190 [Planctomycetota bacterium]REK39620.1 MAG: hypothetical protein DWQ45_01755 [Planctomycetota bacterium]